MITGGAVPTQTIRYILNLILERLYSRIVQMREGGIGLNFIRVMQERESGGELVFQFYLYR